MGNKVGITAVAITTATSTENWAESIFLHMAKPDTRAGIFFTAVQPLEDQENAFLVYVRQWLTERGLNADTISSAE